MNKLLHESLNAMIAIKVIADFMHFQWSTEYLKALLFVYHPL